MKSFASPAKPSLQEQGFGLWRPRADWTAVTLRFLIASQHAGRLKKNPRSQSPLTLLTEAAFGKRALRWERRTKRIIIPMLRLRAMLNNSNSKTGISSHLLTQVELTREFDGFNRKFPALVELVTPKADQIGTHANSPPSSAADRPSLTPQLH